MSGRVSCINVEVRVLKLSLRVLSKKKHCGKIEWKAPLCVNISIYQVFSLFISLMSLPLMHLNHCYSLTLSTIMILINDFQNIHGKLFAARWEFFSYLKLKTQLRAKCHLVHFDLRFNLYSLSFPTQKEPHKEPCNTLKIPNDCGLVINFNDNPRTRCHKYTKHRQPFLILEINVKTALKYQTVYIHHFAQWSSNIQL